jgi:hypothetical protein
MPYKKITHDTPVIPVDPTVLLALRQDQTAGVNSIGLANLSNANFIFFHFLFFLTSKQILRLKT